MKSDDDSGMGFVCEFDTEADLARALRDSNLPKKRWNWIQRHHGSFTGRQLKKWLDGTGEDGLEAAKRLMDKNFITSVQKNVTEFRADGTMYQLVEQQRVGYERCMYLNFEMTPFFEQGQGLCTKFDHINDFL